MANQQNIADAIKAAQVRIRESVEVVLKDLKDEISVGSADRIRQAVNIDASKNINVNVGDTTESGA